MGIQGWNPIKNLYPWWDSNPQSLDAIDHAFHRSPAPYPLGHMGVWLNAAANHVMTSEDCIDQSKKYEHAGKNACNTIRACFVLLAAPSPLTLLFLFTPG